jgi:NAD(P)-dependent dehydrogenase (short-subunit alcohol dehydrogenase family)
METRARCIAAGASQSHVAIVSVDVTDVDAADLIVAQTMREFGMLDALVNNAGLARFAALDQAEVTDWQRMIETNFLAPATLIRNAIPSLRRSRGAIVNVGSIGGLLALPGRAVYGASKAALAHLTRSLARELAPDIRVNAVLPGAIDTEMYADLGWSDEETARLRTDIVRKTPLGRMGTVDDVVPWIEMLLGPAGDWVTGSLIVVDGGRSC